MGTYDLSRPIRSGMPVYPGTPPVRVEPAATIDADGSQTTSIAFDSHTGTHIDAPAHMLADGRSLDRFPPETFRFDGALADCRPLADREPIDVETIEAAVASTDADLESIDMLVLRTGWAAHWGSDRYFDHPFLAVEAAAWLAERRLHLGIDALNVDPTPTDRASADDPTDYPAHHALFDAERLIVENLCGLDALSDRFELHAYPLAIEAADGSPVRAIAVTP
ncbi:MAG: cyclase family protein [Halobacteriota archaeon]